jgi:chromosome segregation ATPase
MQKTTTYEIIKIVREAVDEAQKPLLRRSQEDAEVIARLQKIIDELQAALRDREGHLEQVVNSEAKFHAAFEQKDAYADELAEQNHVLRYNNENLVRRIKQLEEEIAQLRADLETHASKKMEAIWQ